MKITDLLSIESIDMNASITSKEEAINHLVDLMDASGNINDKEAYKKGILEREAKSTTGVGEGIAIPHAQVEAVLKPGLAVMVVKEGVDYQSLDNLPARLFFMIAAPKDGGSIHLETLARLSGMLMDSDFKESLINAKDAREFIKLIDEKERENEESSEENKSSGYDVLAVTACPTGIAHTFMAAQSLEAKAKEMNISFKVETNGATGPKNILTDEEINNAKCIIVAADKQVEMSRFDGKPVIVTKVANGINKAEELLNSAMNDDIAIYHHKGEKIDNKQSNQGVVRTIYTQLTDALSKMLPIIIGTGALMSIMGLLAKYNMFGLSDYDSFFIINSRVIWMITNTIILILFSGFIGQAIAGQQGFAVGVVSSSIMLINSLYTQFASPGLIGAIIVGFIAGYIVILLQKICDKLPECLEGIKSTVIYPIFGMIIAGAISFLISVYLEEINSAITTFIVNMDLTQTIILGVIVGGMMSIDMGGPINKLAYIFGIYQIIEGNYNIMAAVMAGGMVPPIAIAISTTLFKNKFSLEDRKLGTSNYLKGLMFISEGTIPFVQKDRKLVTLTCIITSAIAGGLSMYWNCWIMLPHGGIFVLPLINNPQYFVLTLFIASIIGGIMYGCLKKEA